MAWVDPAITGVVVLVGVGKDLVAGGSALTSRDDRPRKEDLPHSEHASTAKVAVLAVELSTEDVLLVGHPVVIPLVQSVGVVSADVLHGVNLESGKLELANVPVEGSRGISPGEDVLGHEQSPGDILPVGTLAKASNLHEEQSIVGHQAADATKVGVDEVGKTNVLGHLDGGNLVELAVLRDVTVIHAQDLGVDTFLLVALHAPLLALHGQGDTSSDSTEVAHGVAGEGTPAAANIKEALALLQLQLLADKVHLVGLCLLQRLLETLEDARSVHHGRAHESIEESVATIVVLRNFLCGRLDVLLGGVAVAMATLPREQLLDKPPELSPSDLVVDEFVAVELEHLPAVPALDLRVESDLAVNEQLDERSHGNAAVVVGRASGFVVEDHVLGRVDASVSRVVDLPADVDRELDQERNEKEWHLVDVLVQRFEVRWVLPDQVRSVAERSDAGKAGDGDTANQEDQDRRGVGDPGGHVPSELDFLHADRLGRFRGAGQKKKRGGRGGEKLCPTFRTGSEIDAGVAQPSTSSSVLRLPLTFQRTRLRTQRAS